MVYLRKANNDIVNHCKCVDGYISAPAQMDCPWCGCGWLFTCSDCRKAFTFADAVEVDFTLEEMAHRNLRYWRQGSKPSVEDDIRSWIEFMTAFLRNIQLNQRYVYFDGLLVPVTADGLTFEGIHSSHDLAVVPQVEALRDKSIIRDLMSNPHYWQNSALREDRTKPSQ